MVKTIATLIVVLLVGIAGCLGTCARIREASWDAEGLFQKLPDYAGYGWIAPGNSSREIPLQGPEGLLARATVLNITWAPAPGVHVTLFPNYACPSPTCRVSNPTVQIIGLRQFIDSNYAYEFLNSISSASSRDIQEQVAMWAQHQSNYLSAAPLRLVIDLRVLNETAVGSGSSMYPLPLDPQDTGESAVKASGKALRTELFSHNWSVTWITATRYVDVTTTSTGGYIAVEPFGKSFARVWNKQEKPLSDSDFWQNVNATLHGVGEQPRHGISETSCY